MSQLVRSWIVDDVGLAMPDDRPLEALAGDGRLFVRLLERLGVIPLGDAGAGKQRPEHPEAIQRNWLRAHDGFVNLGVVCTPNTIQDVIAGKPGAALHLLHAVKVHWERSQVAQQTAPAHDRRNERMAAFERRHLTEMLRWTTSPGVLQTLRAKAAAGQHSPGRARPQQVADRHKRFRLERLAELDERIRQRDYADECTRRHLDHCEAKHGEMAAQDEQAQQGVAVRRLRQRQQRVTAAQAGVSRDLAAFDESLLGKKARAADINDDNLLELIRQRADAQERDDQSRRKRLDKVLRDRFQDMARLRAQEGNDVARALTTIGSNSERDVQQQMLQVAKVETIAERRRSYYEQEKQRIAAVSADVALRRDRQHFALEKMLYEDRLRDDQQRIVDCRAAARRRVSRHNRRWCGRMVNGLVALAVRRSTYRSLARRDMPDDEWDACKDVFRWQDAVAPGAHVEGRVDSVQYKFVMSVRDDYVSAVTMPEEVQARLDRRQMKMFLARSAPWWADGLLESETDASALGRAVHDVVGRATVQPPLAPAIATNADLVFVIGKRFSGKTTVANAIARSLSYVVIDVDALATGPVSDDNAFVNLVCNAIVTCGQQAAGVVVDGFPTSVTQAALLERALSGFTIPGPAPDANGNAGRDRASDIVPYPDGVPAVERPPFGCSKMAVVLHVDLDDSAVERRALGRRIDPMTGDTYWLDGADPPFDQVVKERLVDLPGRDAIIVNEQVPEELFAWSRKYPPLSAFLNLFQVLHTVNGAGEPASVISDAIAVVERVVKGKKKDVGADVGPAPVAAAQDGAMKEPADVAADFLDRDLVDRLYRQWMSIETAYVAQVQNVFRNDRLSRHPAVEFFSDTIAKFGSFVTRDDPRQALIDKFVGEFNAIPRVMRVEDVIKDELHERARELAAGLVAILDAKNRETSDAIDRILKDPWFERQADLCLERFLSLLQAEAGRHQSAILFFDDLDRCKGGRPPPPTTPTPLRIDGNNGEVPAAVETTPVKKGAAAGGGGPAAPAAAKPAATLAPATTPDSSTGSSVIDNTGRYTSARALDALSRACRLCIDLATGKDDIVETPLVRQERIVTRNRCRRLAARGEVQLRDLCNHANQLIDTLRSIAADRQLKERACIDPALHLIRQTIESESVLYHPMKVVDGVDIVVDRSVTLYDDVRDRVESAFAGTMPRGATRFGPALQLAEVLSNADSLEAALDRFADANNVASEENRLVVSDWVAADIGDWRASMLSMALREALPDELDALRRQLSIADQDNAGFVTVRQFDQAVGSNDLGRLLMVLLARSAEGRIEISQLTAP